MVCWLLVIAYRPTDADYINWSGERKETVAEAIYRGESCTGGEE